MFGLETAYSSFLFRLDTLTWTDALDIILVTIAIYFLFSLIRRSQVAFLLRGIVALILLLLLANLLLPLPTTGSILSFALIAIFIAVPITLQPELRRWLEQFGRRFGFNVSQGEELAEALVYPLTRTAENLAASRTGALMVLEGLVPLTEVIASGVPLNGRVSSELLQTIFFDKTPLHDGAVVIRREEIVAASCVLPLSERELRGRSRIGTRHRAAIGLSEVADALTIVVSEESGIISIAQSGRLERNLDRTALHQRIVHFYTSQAELQPIVKWRPWRNWHFQMPGPRRLLANLGYLLLSFLLAAVATSAVREQGDPLETRIVNNVPLVVEDEPEGMVMTTRPPAVVSVQFQTPRSELTSLTAGSFQASVSLAEAVVGANRLDVEVNTTADKVLINGTQPSVVDVVLSPVVSETLPVTVRITDTDELSSAYEVSGQAASIPVEATVTGPQSAVGQVVMVATEISVAGATTTVQQPRPLLAFDAVGVVVPDVIIEPAEVEATAFVRRRINARDLGVHAVTTGSPPDGYWLSGLSVNPASVTVQGDPNTIAEMPSFVDTLPVDISEARGDLAVDTTLELPPGVQVLDSGGNVLGTVTVLVQIEERSGDLLLTRPVELIANRGDLSITLDPPEVELLLSGPLPKLNEIEMNPGFVRVQVNVADLAPGQTVELTPKVTALSGVEVQLTDSSVLVTAAP